MPPSDLSPGAAAIAQDVMFPQGALRTRGGLLNFFGAGSPIPANASINGLKSYITPTLQKRLLAWDNLGNFYKETPQGTLNLLSTRPYVNLLYSSQSLFGREYQAFFNSLGGFDIPRQYDDTNWDRVSQVGPGIAPDAADENLSVAIVASPNGLANLTGTSGVSPTGLVEAGNIVTVTIGSGPVIGLKSGDQIIITAATNAGYNGTFHILNVIDTTHFTYVATATGLPGDGGATINFSIGVVFTSTAITVSVGELVTIAGAGVATYNGTWPVTQIISATEFTVDLGTLNGLAASGNGTVALAGSISAGLHQISVAFITRQGFITKAAVPKSFIASGLKRVIATNIAIGPSNVVSRLLLFTPVITPPAVTGSFFSLPNGSTQIFTSTMLISDNTTTTATVDFTDPVLISGFSANYLFTQNELGECAFMIPYNARTVWLGERNKIQNLVNPTFDGGFAGGFPDGWTKDATNSAGGSSAVAGGFTADWADAYAITGDGATAIRGKITQSAYQDYLGVAIIGNTTSYSVRARIARNGTLAAGTLHINLQSTSGAFTTTGLAVTAAQAGLTYAEFTAVITAALANPPTDLLLQVYADGTPTNNGVFLVDSIEIYPTNTPFNYSTARFAHAFNPESFDATTGQLQVRPSDGTQLQAGFPLRNNLYLAKDHYLCYVTDDGVNEPASWAVNEVSATVGICGPNAVDWTEEWATFAERSGLYVFFGGDPVKITPEIQLDASGTGKISWQSINWQFGYTVWVRIDKVNKMILVGAPTGKNPDGGLISTPNTVFMFDYKWLEGGQDIASSPMVTYSQFTGKILSHGRGRRCALWTITANSMCFAERSDGTVQPFFGNGKGNGKIYQQIDCATQSTDDGAAIPWQYQGYGAPSAMEEQQYQLSAHRKLLGYMKWRAVGVGLMPLFVTTAQRTIQLRSYALSLTPTGDGERPVNMHGERFFPQIGPNTVPGSWFQAEKLCLCVKRDAAIPVRGLSA